MDCPRCSVEVTELAQGDSTMQRCPDCGGLWIDVSDLNKMLLHSNLPALPALGGFVNVDEMAGMCPACQVDLVVVEGGERRSVHYDTCESCGGIWVEGPDEDEIPEAIDWDQATKQIVGVFRRFAKKK
jgi:Zn-finger nucleic acid-binding protein